MKKWFITGASSGLGLGMTERLLMRGDAVIATVRRVEALAELKALHPDRLTVERLDVTDTAALRHTVDRAFADGRIDVVVSNAAMVCSVQPRSCPTHKSTSRSRPISPPRSS